MKISLLLLNKYLFCVVSDNRYLPRSSNEILVSMYITSTVFVPR